jgi:hypothetical protein
MRGSSGVDADRGYERQLIEDGVAVVRCTLRVGLSNVNHLGMKSSIVKYPNGDAVNEYQNRKSKHLQAGRG